MSKIWKRKDPLPKIVNISKEQQKIFEEARKYCGEGKWSEKMPGTRKTSKGYWTEEKEFNKPKKTHQNEKN